ncbi:MAG: hypothetical protein HRT98_02185 [Mycoplasmatales bacterium]|nr:hypothetical protein [Mycoplasmatales bacterium]
MKQILRENKYFLIGAIISTIFIILMIISDSTTALNWTVTFHNKGNVDLKHAKYPIEHVNWITVFYFTFQSNFLVMIYLYLRAFGVIKPKENKHHKMFQLITTLNITITMITYWTILAPFSTIWTHGGVAGTFKIIVTFMVHLITPILMLVAFHKDKLQENEEGVVLSMKKIPLVLIYPIAWLIMAIVIYFVTKTESHYSQVIINKATGEYILVKDGGPIVHSAGVAVYFFLNFAGVPLWITLGACAAITILFIVFGFLFFAISNPKSKLNKIIKNIKQRK